MKTDSVNIGDSVTKLVEALLNRDFHRAKELLAEGTDIDSRNANGWTPLHFTVENFVPEAVQFLLENNANPNLGDLFGATPLHLAIDTEIARFSDEFVRYKAVAPTLDLTALLLKHGADPNIKDNEGETPLDWAMSLRHTPAIDLLKHYGAQSSASA
jgi:ankyrin repeat protein